LTAETRRGKTAPPEVAPNIARLVPYSPGKPIEEVERELGISDVVKLASNENALGPSPRAVAAMREAASRMSIYPDADSVLLREALGSFLGVPPASILLGNGSDDIIHLLGVTFLQPGDEVIQAHPSFVRYEAAALLNGAKCHLVPLNSAWEHDLDAMAERVNPCTRLVFLCNPNNPTGAIVRKEPLERFLNALPERVIAVMDEAYYEYASPAPDYPQTIAYTQERNVVVLRTFSKAYGLAGLRVGYGVMRPEIAGWLNRTREPFNVNYMAQIAAFAAIDDVEHVARSVAMNEEGKRAICAGLESLGLCCAPTYANFVWVDAGKPARALFDGLLRKGVIVRTGDPFGAPTHLRITIGTADQNERMLRALADVLPTL
jgi:histidinol-phosphate aminotransferase